MKKSNSELAFWRDLCNGGNIERIRKIDYNDNFKNFPSFKKQKGLGLEVGSGLVSMLEFSDKNAISIDPLMDEYNKIYKMDGDIICKNMDGEDLKFDDNSFDYVVNINVIDHTPNPDKMIDEIYRVLKKGSKLYFEVHFDRVLGDAHYNLWNKETVKKHLKKFKLNTKKVIDMDFQSKYYAEYIK